MKWLHRLIVTSDTYQLSSKAEQLGKNRDIDPRDTYLWHFRLQRLEAEPIWDAIHYASDDLNLEVGGKSFQLDELPIRSRRFSCRRRIPPIRAPNRRGVY